MNSNKTREGPKTAGGGGGSNKTAKQSNTNKSDSKSDKADLIAKKTPTPEQMQIARIIDTHRIEDPELLKKMKQVQEVTGASEDDASMALHSREYDVEQAITLLTEGGSESLDAEWEQAGGKKRKPKGPSSKLEVVKERPGAESGEKGARERSEKRDGKGERGADRRDGEIQGDGSEFRGRGSGRGGRGGRGGPRGRGISNRTDTVNENEQPSQYDGGSRGRYMNGPGRGGRGRGIVERGDLSGGRGGRGGGGRDRVDRDGPRTFASRARGPRDGDFSNHPIDVWENSQADAKSDKKPLKVEQWDEFPSAEDWDNEEYTGSLSESKVFTPSTQPSSVPASMTDGTNGVANANNSLTETTASTNHIGASGNVGSMIGGLNGTAGPGGVVTGQSLDVNMIFAQQKTQKMSGSSVAPGGNPGANILASLQSSATLQSSYSNATQQGQVANSHNSQALPQRQKVQRPPQRMPPSGVEMPDDAVGKLDVQFGGLEFGTTGSTFNSVVQHGVPKGAGDMLYASSIQQQKIDTFAGDSDLQNKTISSVPAPEPSPFQGRNQQQGIGPSSLVGGNESLNSKTATMSPQSGDSHGTLGSAISSQSKRDTNAGNKQSQQQQSQYANSANSGSAFVSYPGKGAPGFPAPGFPPVSQSTSGNVGAVPYMSPSGPVYGSQQNPMMLTQPAGYNVGSMSSYGNQPIVTGPLQLSGAMSQGMPSQNLGPMASAYGTTAGYQYNPSGVPVSASNSNQYGGYGKLQNSVNSPPGPLKETGNDTSSAPASSSTSQHGSATTLQSTTSTTASSKTSGIPSSGVGSSTSTSSKMPGGNSNTTTGTGGLPPGMMLQPQYIMNQGVPMYGFQGPMYGYDENSMQFLPRLPHQLPAGYFDASGAYVSADAQMRNTNYSFVAPTGGVPSTGRTDGGSMQSYQVTDGRFPRSDSSTGSPVPSNLPGQTTQPLQYNPIQYMYYGNPGGYPYGPPPMYQTTAMGTPANPTSATGSNQYGNKNYFQNPYLTSYDTGIQGGLAGGVTDFGKNSYQSGVGSGSSSGKGPGSSSTNSQAQDITSSMYGNKGHLNNMKNYDKPSYGGSTGSPYNSLPQQTSNMGGAGMGGPYNVYMPATQPVLPALFNQDGVTGQRQGSGQPKGGNKQYGSQQYWAGGN